MYTLSTLNTLFITASNNSISIEINKACTFIFAEYKNTMAKIEIRSSTTAKDNKKIFKFEFILSLNIINIPMAKAISVDMATSKPKISNFEDRIFIYYHKYDCWNNYSSK